MYNETDVKITIKRRKDGVYDIYLDSNWVHSCGSIMSTVKRIEELLMEDFNVRNAQI